MLNTKKIDREYERLIEEFSMYPLTKRIRDQLFLVAVQNIYPEAIIKGRNDE